MDITQQDTSVQPEFTLFVEMEAKKRERKRKARRPLSATPNEENEETKKHDEGSSSDLENLSEDGMYLDCVALCLH